MGKERRTRCGLGGGRQCRGAGEEASGKRRHQDDLWCEARTPGQTRGNVLNWRVFVAGGEKVYLKDHRRNKCFCFDFHKEKRGLGHQHFLIER